MSGAASVRQITNVGRAPGFVLLVALQSPKKEVVGARHEWCPR
jgi:hypothetical protein